MFPTKGDIPPSRSRQQQDESVEASEEIPIVVAELSEDHQEQGGEGDAQQPMIAITEAEVVIEPSTAVPIQVSDSDSFTRQSPQQPQELQQQQQQVSVISPSALPEGYIFVAQVDGMNFEVTVPPGGVQEGQSFLVPHPRYQIQSPLAASHYTRASIVPFDTIEPNVEVTPYSPPEGGWKTGLCDCCETYPSCLFWQGLCCTPVLTGQLAQRLGLNIWGESKPTPQVSTCQTSTILFVVVHFLLFMGIGLAIWPVYVVFVTFLMSQMRQHMRRRYKIDGSCCDHWCDDFCCVIWCRPCVAVQMEMHTRNIDSCSYEGCTETGLAVEVPLAV